MTHRKAFTLVEMLAVIGIILLLTVMLVPVTLKVQERDQVGKGASILQGLLTQAKNRALKENKNIGVRLRYRINQGEIPPGKNLFDSDQDGQITFFDLNSDIRNRGAGGANDVGLDGIIWPIELFADQTAYGTGNTWVDRDDNDGNGFPDDIVVADEFELVEQPPDYRDGWVWAPVFPSAPTAPRTIQHPAFDIGRPPVFNPVTDGFPPYWAPVTYPDPGFNNRLFAPYIREWKGGPLDATTFNPQRAPTYDFHRAMYDRGEIQKGDLLELLGGGQLYTIIDTVARNPSLTRWSPSQLILDRPLPADVHPPRNLLSNYRIIRQPRPLAGEQTTRLPASIVINLVPSIPRTRGNAAKAIPPDPPYWDGTLHRAGLTFGLPLDKPNLDIVFSPSGQVININSDWIFLWLVDTSPGNTDSQILVAIYTRTGKISTFPVEQLGPDPWAHTRVGRAEGG